MVQTKKNSVAGAILVGGKSQRMGTPKDSIVLPDNRTMLEHGIDTLLPICSKIIIVGHTLSQPRIENADIIHLADNQPGLGPISGIEALLSSGLAEQYLVFACDQPLLTSDLLKQLISEQVNGQTLTFFRSQEGEQFDPFPGIYPISFLPQVQNAIYDKHFSLRKLIQKQLVQWLGIAPEVAGLLYSANTPEELKIIENRLKSGYNQESVS